MDKAILVVSFGTSFRDARQLSLEAIEKDVSRAFPDRLFYRAWTSAMLTKKLRETQNLRVDTVPEAMERMLRDGVRDLLVQPTHMMCGAEFEKVRAAILAYGDRFQTLRVGAPLLASPEDISALAKVIEREFEKNVEPGDLLVLMGHGSAKPEGAPYAALEAAFRADGFQNYRIGTVEFAPGFEPVLQAVRETKPHKVWLLPLLVVAGDHAFNDMAGDEPDSWASRIAAEGPEPVCVLCGLGEFHAVREMYVAHARQALQA